MPPRRAVLFSLAFLTFLPGEALLGEPPQPPTLIRTDHYGDPLPKDTRFRLGTVRLRHIREVTSLAWLPDSRTLASAGWDQTVRLWRIPGGKQFAEWDYMEGVVFSPDGRSLACGKTIYTGKELEKEIRIIDVATGEERRTIRVPKTGNILDNVTAGRPPGCYSADGKILAVVERESGIRLYGVDSGKEIGFLKIKVLEYGHPVAFAPDNRSLLAATEKGVYRWTISTGATDKVLADIEGTVRSFTFSPDGKMLAAAASDGFITLRNWPAGKELRRLEIKGRAESCVLRFSPDGKLLASGESETIRLWNPATGELMRCLEGHTYRIWDLAFSPDGSLLASASADSTVAVWEVGAGKSPRPLIGVQHWLELVGLSADGQELLTRSADGILTVWNVRDGRRLRTLGDGEANIDRFLLGPDASRKRAMLRKEIETGRDRPGFFKETIICSAFSPDNALLAISSCVDGRILLLQKTDQGIVDRPLIDAASVQQASKRGLDVAVQRLTFSPDGRFLAATYGDGRLILWDPGTGRPRHSLRFTRHGEPYRGLQFSADGRLLAVSDLHVLFLVETASGQAFWKRPLGEHWIDSFAFSPDNRTLAIGDAGSQAAIHLWDLTANKEFHTLQGHRYSVWSLVFSPDGTSLLSGSGDKTVLCWDVAAILRRRVTNKHLTAAKLTELWNDLASKNAERAQRAVGELIQAPDAVLPFLEKSLPPVTPALMARIASLIADLDHAEFARRDKASTELGKIGALAAPALRKVLTEKPTLELRRRVDALLEALDARPLSPQELRPIRAVQVLETIGTPQAQRILKRLSGGAPDAQRTEEAKAALQRLKRLHAKL